MSTIGRFIVSLLLFVYGLGSFIQGALQISRAQHGMGFANVIIAIVCFSIGMRLMRRVAEDKKAEETETTEATTTTTSTTEVRRSNQTAS